MGKTKLDREIYPDNYYLQETSNSQHYGNILLTSMKRMEGNICIDITFKNGSVGTPSVSYTVTNNNIIITPSVVNSEGWITASTITGNSMSIPVSAIVQVESVSVKSTLATLTITPTSGKYINQINVEPIVRQNETFTPTTSTQTINYDSNYDCLGQVTVEAVPAPYTIPSGSIAVTKTGESSEWVNKTWNNLPSGFSGNDVWTDGENIYYSHTNVHKVLNKVTSTWEDKEWNGLSNFDGENVWTDGEDIYYSNGSNSQYILNKSNSTWSSKSWSRNIIGKHIWRDGLNVYYSYWNGNIISSSIQLKYNKLIDDWDSVSWYWNSALSPSYSIQKGEYVWTDGENIYYSISSSDNYRLIRDSTSWEQISLIGMTSIRGDRIWRDGVNTFYLNSKIYDKENNVWNDKTWTNSPSSFDPTFLWTDGKHIYYSDGTNNMELLVNNGYDDVTNYASAYVSTEEISLTPTDDGEIVYPSTGKLIKKVTVAPGTFPTGNITITQRTGTTVSDYATADVTPSMIWAAGSKYGSTIFVSVTPSSFPYYIGVNEGWFGIGNIEIKANSNLVASNIKSSVTIFGVTGTYVPQELTTYDGTYVTGTNT